MKKVILIITAVVLVFSGVAAVSAYEAHIINVKARVEHALEIKGAGSGPLYAIDWETAFPQEWLTANFTVAYSSSFCQQDRVHAINYTVYAEPKPQSEAIWGGDFMYIGWYDDDPGACGNLNTVGSTWARVDNVAAAAVSKPDDYYADHTLPTSPTIFNTGITGTLEKETGQGGAINEQDFLCFAMDVPAFEGFWNEATDVDEKPSGLAIPTVVIEEADSARWDDVAAGGSRTFGANIKIQVTNIWSSYP